MITIRKWLLHGGIWLMSMMPWCIIRLYVYPLSWFLRHVLAYRRKVVCDNLKGCFPEKSQTELNRLERDYYRYLVRLFLSTPKQLTMSDKKIKRYMRLENLEVLTDLRDKGYTSIIAMMGHFGSWEVFSAAPIYYRTIGITHKHIYLRPNDPVFDAEMLKLRSRHGAIGIERAEIGRELLLNAHQQDGSCSTFGFIADQSPVRENANYVTRFMGRTTAFITGAEHLARRLHLPVVYMDVIPEGDFAYVGRFRLLSEHPENEPPCAITEQYARLMETTIMRAPERWLWSHRRWKLDLTDLPHQTVWREDLKH